MAKFKAGDKVKIVRAANLDERKGIGWNNRMEDFVGKPDVYTIDIVVEAYNEMKQPYYRFEEEQNKWGWPECCLEPVPHVWAKGDKVQIIDIIDAYLPEPRMWCEPMWEFVNDGKVYELLEQYFAGVDYVHEQKFDWWRFTDNDCLGYWFPINSFRLVEGAADVKKEEKKPKPVKKKPKRVSLRAELTKRVGVRPGTCSYALEFSNGHRRFQVKDICHARLNWGGYYDENMSVNKDTKLKEVALNLKGHYDGFLNAESKKHYSLCQEYMIQRSPFRTAFKTKTWAVAKRYGVQLDVNVQLSRACAGAIALRLASEFHNKNKLFVELVKEGVSEHAAFLVSQGFNPFKENEYAFNEFNGSHHVFIGSMYWDDVKKFMNEGFFLKQNETAYKDAYGKHYMIFKCIANEREDGNNTTLKEMFKKHFKGIVVGTGWDKKTHVTKEDVYNCAKQIDIALKA